MYNFRLKFGLSYNASFNCEKDSIRIDLTNNKSFILRPAKDKTLIKNTSIYIIKGEGFSTEEEAYNQGKRAENALLWYGVKYNIGVDFKKGKTKFGIGMDNKKNTIHSTKAMEDFFYQKFNVKVLNDEFGLTIYPENKEQTLFISGLFSGSSKIPIENFIEIFQQGFDINLDEKEYLALELYSSSIFEASISTKFLILIITIESLIPQEKRGSELISYLNILMKQTEKAKLSEDNINILKNGLGNLKRESILSGGKKLLRRYIESKNYNGKSAEAFFDECYKIRSNLVHYGNPRISEEDFGKVTNTLSKMVNNLLISMIEEKNSNI